MAALVAIVPIANIFGLNFYCDPVKGNDMLTGVENYYRPRTLQEALGLLLDESRKNVLLGGGSILALSNSPGIEGLIDINDLGLDGIKDTPEFLEIGACSTMRQIQKARHTHFDRVISTACENYLTALIRNQAELGGILAGAFDSADLVAVLIALDATVNIYTREGEKGYPLATVYTNPHDYFERNIITRVTIPKLGQKIAYHRIAKVATDTSIISAVVCEFLDPLCLHSVPARGRYRLVLNACAHSPVRLHLAEEYLQSVPDQSGRDFSKIEELIDRELKTISDFRATASYRKEMAKVLIKRGIDYCCHEEC